MYQIVKSRITIQILISDILYLAFLSKIFHCILLNFRISLMAHRGVNLESHQVLSAMKFLIR